MIITSISWLAIFALSVSYWFQIRKIHLHREVRDLSMIYHILLFLGFSTLAITAYMEKSIIFLVKQIATSIPVFVIICQILYHRKDHWHEIGQASCLSCREELEADWICCPYCSASKDVSVEEPVNN
ncbi:MAG: PQ-loop repeat-containing protein [Waddliaceae bacterium]|nr:PQ-loop repeat-containing protein [Waddliaceae bacterium]MBT7264598.1 PQ-loop repeat-containing protein [Waddliaceae bacterium]